MTAQTVGDSPEEEAANAPGLGTHTPALPRSAHACSRLLAGPGCLRGRRAGHVGSLTSSPGAQGNWTWGGLPGVCGAAGCICWIPEGGSAAGLGSDLLAGPFCGCAGSGDSGLARLCGTVSSTLRRRRIQVIFTRAGSRRRSRRFCLALVEKRI